MGVNLPQSVYRAVKKEFEKNGYILVKKDMLQKLINDNKFNEDDQ